MYAANFWLAGLPVAMDCQRQLITIRPAGIMRAGNPWPGLDRRSVRPD